MFQFPGFALKTLCIQVISTWSCSLLTAPKRNNNKQSGGLPHSEIAGSKPILGSPALIAEYHVLHRLLLPRHSPNALLALDLIQKEQGLRPARHRAGPSSASVPGSKAYFSRLASGQTMSHLAMARVSVLDLEQHVRFRAVSPPTLRERREERFARPPKGPGTTPRPSPTRDSQIML